MRRGRCARGGAHRLHATAFGFDFTCGSCGADLCSVEWVACFVLQSRVREDALRSSDASVRGTLGFFMAEVS